MAVDTHSQLKNIVDEWFEQNSDKLQKGFGVDNPQQLFKYEHTILALILQLGTMILTYILKSRIEKRPFQLESNKMAREDLGPDIVNKNYRDVKIRLLTGGAATVHTTYFLLEPKKKCGRKKTKRGVGQKGLYPALSRLGIHYRTTPALISRVSREMAEGPSIEGVQRRLAWFGNRLDVKTIQRITKYLASAGIKWRKKWVTERVLEKAPVSESFAGKRVAIGVDGGRIRIRKNRKGRLPKGKRHHRYDTDWHEPKLFSIGILDKHGRISRRHQPIYDGTLGNADAIFEMLEAYLSYYSIEKAEQIIFLGDGAPWIWERVSPLIERLGVDPKRVHQCLDFYHATEHLNEVLDLVSWTKKKKKRWFRRMRSKLRKGHVNHVIAKINDLCRGRNAALIRKKNDYFIRYRDRMNYRALKSAHLPIGSGMIESTIRRVINLRLKGAGTFWLRENAEGLIFLRSYLKADRWCDLLGRVLGYLSIGTDPHSLEVAV